MHDAVVLANYIHALPDHPTADEIQAAFKAYKDERIEWVKMANEGSQAMRIMVDKEFQRNIITLFAIYGPNLGSIF